MTTNAAKLQAKPGIKTLLVGPTGTGKTHAIRSLTDSGLTVLAIFTEPGFEGILGDIPPDRLHWHYIAPAAQSWDTLIDTGKKINTLSHEALQKLPGVNKNQQAQMLELFQVCNNFVCQRTGESFGDVAQLDASYAVVVDSLSGLNQMSMNLTAGSKPIKTLVDWGCAMDLLERLITQFTTGLRCHFILTAHLEREIDEVLGGVTLTVSTLGRKLAPKIIRYFDDVVLTKREGNTWTWSTAALNADLKARNFPWSDKIPPTFKPTIDQWKSKP